MVTIEVFLSRAAFLIRKKPFGSVISVLVPTLTVAPAAGWPVSSKILPCKVAVMGADPEFPMVGLGRLSFTSFWQWKEIIAITATRRLENALFIKKWLMIFDLSRLLTTYTAQPA